MLQIRAIRR